MTNNSIKNPAPIKRRIRTAPEKALLVDETTRGTLINSVGPDLEDQHGQASPEAFRGVIGRGDIAIRVGR